jgi:transcriptional antiterminator NusG
MNDATPQENTENAEVPAVEATPEAPVENAEAAAEATPEEAVATEAATPEGTPEEAAATDSADAETAVAEEAKTIPAPEPMTKPGMDWYILRVNTGYEDRVQKGLEARVEQHKLQDQIGRCVVPKKEVLEFRLGEKRRIKRKLYPGYVFVEILLNVTTQSLIREIPRVTGFVGAQDRASDPKPMSKREIHRLMAHIETVTEEPTVVQHFERGDKVKIIDGAFTNFQGSVEEVREERRKLRVLVTIFGRQTPVEVNYNQVDRVE